jgi:hypothetical protein
MSETGSLYSIESNKGDIPGGSSRDDRRKQKEALALRTTIAETVRLAFKEKEASKEAHNARLEEKRTRERIFDLSSKVNSAINAIQELKKDNRIELLEKKLNRSNEHIAELKKENKAMAEKFNQQIERLEKKMEGGFAAERTKRLSLFNRWAKKHAEDVEQLRMSVEESLTHIDERSNREWDKQGRALDVLREKIDIALIRRLGYLPTTTANASFAPSSDYHFVPGGVQSEVAVEEAPAHSISSSNVSGEKTLYELTNEMKNRDKEEAEEDEEDMKLRSKISAFFASSPPHSRREKEKIDMDMGIDREYVLGPNPSSSSPALPSQVERGGGNTPTVRPPFAESVETAGLYNQGLDAHQVIQSMDSRLAEVARHVEQLSKARELARSGKDLVAQRSRRMRQLRNPSTGMSSDDEYPGSDEREFRFGLALEGSHRDRATEESSEEEGESSKHRKGAQSKAKQAGGSSSSKGRRARRDR